MILFLIHYIPRMIWSITNVITNVIESYAKNPPLVSLIIEGLILSQKWTSHNQPRVNRVVVWTYWLVQAFTLSNIRKHTCYHQNVSLICVWCVEGRIYTPSRPVYAPWLRHGKIRVTKVTRWPWWPVETSHDIWYSSVVISDIPGRATRLPQEGKEMIDKMSTIPWASSSSTRR